MRYKPYPKYKDSGVEWLGEIPEDWNKTKLKFLGFTYGGLSGKAGKDFNDEDNKLSKPFIPFTNIAKSMYVEDNYFGLVVINEGEEQNRAKKDDLFFLMSSEDYEDLGKSSLLDFEVKELYLNSFCKGFRLLDINIFPKFLNYLLHGDVYRKLLYTQGNGFTRINLRLEKLNDLTICMPLLQEQQTIANFLYNATAKIDTLIQKQENLIKLLKEKRQALISHAVTKGLNPDVKMKDSGVEWLGEIPEHWTMCKIKYYGIYKSGDFISADSIEKEGKYPVIGGNGLRGYTDNFNLEGNYVIIGRQGALCGNINYSQGKFWATEHAIVVYNKKTINVKWLGVMLSTMNLNQYSVSAAQPGLAVENIINLISILPPLNEQKEIAQYLDEKTSKIDLLSTKATKAIELLKEKRTALISSVVTGKIDVREET